jgi:hypothetical protein
VPVTTGAGAGEFTGGLLGGASWVEVAPPLAGVLPPDVAVPLELVAPAVVLE